VDARFIQASMPIAVRNTVLIVEDHREVRSVLARALRKANLEVLEAETAGAAREMLDAALVDAVITDIALPGSIDGVELGRWIRFRFPRMPMVFISGLTPYELPGAPVRDALTRFVCKPFGARLLVEHVRSLLAHAEAVAAEP
jgi:DNA-binding response OmpR family regulator